MSIYAQLSISRDGYLAGPDPSLEEPLGRGGMQLHDWVVRLRAWRAAHGLEGGEDGPESAWVEEIAARTGAYVMGRKMFSGGSGPWQDDPNANGWWGDEPPFGQPVFVLTHHEREDLVLGETTFHFVTGGIEEAVSRAREAAGDKDVHIAGGASAIQQTLGAGLLDELLLHVVPQLLGGGTPLFAGGESAQLDLARTVPSETVTHLWYRVRR